MRVTSSVLAVVAVLAGASAPATASPKPHRMGFAFAWSGGRLGAEVIDISEELRRLLGAPDDRGLLINRVEADSPAAQAGLQVGDVLTDIDGQKVSDSGELLAALAEKKAGERAT